mgnify:CR=1 FL=1
MVTTLLAAAEIPVKTVVKAAALPIEDAFASFRALIFCRLFLEGGGTTEGSGTDGDGNMG